MKLSRRPNTRTDAITVTLLAAAGAVFGCIAGATIGGTPTALGLSFMGSVSGALGGVLLCFCRKPGDTRVSLERVAILCFVFALLMFAVADLPSPNPRLAFLIEISA